MVIKLLCFQTKHGLSFEDWEVREERNCMSLLWIFPALSPTKYLTGGKSTWSPRETQTLVGSFKGQSSRKLKFKKPMMSPLKKVARTHC